MTAEEFRNTIKNESYIGGGSPLHLEFHAFSQRAMKLTCEMNYNYHTPEELRSLMSKLTQSEIDETFGIFPSDGGQACSLPRQCLYPWYFHL